MDVFEVSAEDDEQPIVLLASRQPTRARRGPRFGQVVGSDLWLADTGLAKYSIAPTGNRLPVREVADPFRRDSFVHPLEVIDGVLVHARKRPGKPGVTIGATDLRNGKSYWQTDLAAPRAGAPVSKAGDSAILHATAGGRVFQLDQPNSAFRGLESAAGRERQWLGAHLRVGRRRGRWLGRLLGQHAGHGLLGQRRRPLDPDFPTGGPDRL